MQKDNLDMFIEEIVEEKKLPISDSRVRQQLVDDLRQRLVDQINAALIKALPEDKVDGLNHVLDSAESSDEDVQGYIASSGVDIKRITTQTLLQFRDSYLGTARVDR